jgi:DNA polymerase III subunit delta'
MAFTADIALDYLRSAWQTERLAHAYLVTGADEAARLDLALELIRMVQKAPGADWETLAKMGVQRIEPESKSRKIVVKQIRALEHYLSLRQAEGRWKIGVIVEADRMGEEATNAFLKTLEEPPGRTLLLLLTGRPSQMLTTVLSRCLKIELIDERESGEENRSEEEKVVIDLLAEHFSRPVSVSRAMALQRAYSAHLASLKEKITNKQEKAQKAEAAYYRDTTDASRWIKERDEYHVGVISAQYLSSREESLMVMMKWLGDMLRLQAGVDRLHFPEAEALLRQASGRHTQEDLLQRFSCLEDLHRAYGTNVNEALATELAFVGAFS